MTITLEYDHIKTPIGTIILIVEGQTVCALDFAVSESRLIALLTKRYKTAPTLRKTENPHGYSDLIHSYFAGNIAALENIPVTTEGTEFQQKVWLALRAITPGKTASYQHIANIVGNSKAVRAVGAANHNNPVALIIPCHRIIGSNGKLTGYAGGLEKKSWLLAHEKKHSSSHTPHFPTGS